MNAGLNKGHKLPNLHRQIQKPGCISNLHPGFYDNKIYTFS